MIVVTGATGQLGRHVVEGLREQGAKFAAGVRNTSVDLGVEVRELDYNRPQTIDAALQGAEKVLLISGSEVGKRVPQHTAVVEAAKKAGVGHLVYTSCLHADTTEWAVAPEHKATEEVIRTSGIPYTILRNGPYTENDTDRITLAAHIGVLTAAAGNGRIASATRKDFADAAVAVLTQPGHENKTYELTGDTAWTYAELAEEIASVAGRPVEYRNLSVAQFQQTLVEQAGLPPEIAGFVATLDDNVATGQLENTPGDLRALIGRPTTPVSVTIKEVLGD
jgi:NAD(P)H dehydrogenase (quinone)